MAQNKSIIINYYCYKNTGRPNTDRTAHGHRHELFRRFSKSDIAFRCHPCTCQGTTFDTIHSAFGDDSDVNWYGCTGSSSSHVI